jgi:hypothetical protein
MMAAFSVSAYRLLNCMPNAPGPREQPYFVVYVSYHLAYEQVNTVRNTQSALKPSIKFHLRVLINTVNI